MHDTVIDDKTFNTMVIICVYNSSHCDDISHKAKLTIVTKLRENLDLNGFDI